MFETMNLKLIYRASRDGFSSENFSEQVKNLNPTLIIIKS